AALTAINYRGSLTGVIEPQLPAPGPASTHRPLIQAAVSRLQGENVPMEEHEPAALNVSVEPAAWDGALPDLMESVKTGAKQSESAAPQTNPSETAAAPGPGVEIPETCAGLAVAATPISRQIASLQPKTKPATQLYRRELVSIWAQIRRRSVLHVPMAAVAAIVFLLVPINWRPSDEQPASHANVPVTAESIVPAEPSLIAPPNQPAAPSQGPA